MNKKNIFEKLQFRLEKYKPVKMTLTFGGIFLKA